MCSNSGQFHAFGTGSPPDRTGTGSAEEHFVGGPSMQPGLGVAACLDPFAHCGAFQDADVIPFSSGQTLSVQNSDHDVCCTKPTDTQSPQPVQQTGTRRIPYALAVRLGNYPNPSASAIPLATIIEQGSHSTLDSRRSLLSVGQLSSLGVENASPNRTPRGVPRSLEGNTLQNIQEDTCLESFPLVATDIGESSNREPELGSRCDAATPTRLGLVRYPQGSTPQRSGSDNNGGMKGFVRGVVQNVRGVLHDRSRSWLASHVPTDRVEQRVRPATGENSPQSCHPRACHQQVCDQKGSWSASSRLSSAQAQTTFSGTAHVAVENQARNGAMLSGDGKPVARIGAALQPVSPVGYEGDVTSGSATRGLPRADSTPSEDQMYVFPAPPGRHEVAQEDSDTVGLASRDKVSGRRMLEGFSFVSQEAASVELDKAREEFASRNASFCGTVSTSYSGAVVGVDVDLQYEFLHPVCRSRSATPVWFTRPTAEGRQQECGLKHGAVHESVASPALTSLLPIAAASGIVRCDYTKPMLSYYSPSGRYIQRECSSTPPAAPCLIRMKTGRRKVKGCGGVVREDSLIPRSGVGLSYAKDGAHGRTKGVVCNVRDVVGAHIGRGMRVCFCQPKDDGEKGE